MTAGRLSKLECRTLVDKIMKKVHLWAMKNLSFAGRAQLINSVIFGMFNYWASIFILLQEMFSRLNGFTRNISNDQIGEHTRHQLIVAGTGRRKLQKRKTSSWHEEWKWHQGTKYTIKAGYQWLLGKWENYQWSKLIWARPTSPRHAFITWIFFHQRLPRLWQTAASSWQFRHASSYEEFLSNLNKLKGPRRYKNITMAIIAATLYQVWHAMNTSISKSQSIPVQRAFHQLKEHLTHRILFLNL
ncbi:hypothetical protein Cgig2_017438 [Carnegiea gigantea]|uniref:Reverse transcriptase zinc-binding domain-containing protein n=1 Tax=Carnegiea gigantea TaxID=171969 RepID=A0A9Q1GTI0_9CARY|nr:hypothetical protein Cgig2_017438 [Carnegiea gigantea]